MGKTEEPTVPEMPLPRHDPYGLLNVFPANPKP